MDCLCWCSRTLTSPSHHITSVELSLSFTPPSKSVLACSVILTSSTVILHNRRLTLFSIHCCPLTVMCRDLPHSLDLSLCDFHVLGPLNKVLKAIHSGLTEISMPCGCTGSSMEVFVDRMHKLVHQWPQFLHSRWVSYEQASCIK